MTEQPIGAYIPGAVKNKFARCKRKYYGDEGSLECKPCAEEVKSWFDKLSATQQQDIINDSEKYMNGFIAENIPDLSNGRR